MSAEHRAIIRSVILVEPSAEERARLKNLLIEDPPEPRPAKARP
jgi:hypothetical protein